MVFKSLGIDHLKHEKTKKLFKNAILAFFAFLVIGIILLFLAKLYLPAGILSGFDMSGFLEYGYLGILIITILGGTFFPVGSPAVVTAAGALGLPKLPIIFIAAIGYTIGTYINYLLAYEFGIHYVKKKIGVEVYKDLSRWWNKKALILILLFALLPMLPFNLLALLCGVFRYNLLYFLLINFGSNLLNSYLFVYLGSSAGSWIGLF